MTIPGLIPAEHWPVVPREMHQRALNEIQRLQAELAAARQVPLVAVAPDTRVEELERENVRLKRRLEDVRALLRSSGVLTERS